MKHVSFLFIAFLISACGGSGGSDQTAGASCSTLAGHYYQQFDPSVTMDISSACTFTDSHCGYNANYTLPDSNGNTTVTVIGTNGTPACMSSTAHACQLGFNGVQLSILCDGGAVNFLFIKN